MVVRNTSPCFRFRVIGAVPAEPRETPGMDEVRAPRATTARRLLAHAMRQCSRRTEVFSAEDECRKLAFLSQLWGVRGLRQTPLCEDVNLTGSSVRRLLIDDARARRRAGSRLLTWRERACSNPRPVLSRFVRSDRSGRGPPDARLAAESDGPGYSAEDARGVHDPRPGEACATGVRGHESR
jgi:hypothetical protein